MVRFVESQTDWILNPGTLENRPGHWGIWMMCGG